MFFKKKPKRATRSLSPDNSDGANDESPRNEPENQRVHYRKQAAKSQPLEATLKFKDSDPVPVQLVDLTVRGAGISVSFARDRNLQVGDLVELGIATIMRSEVVAAARVVNVGKRGQGHIRYGLEFLDLGRLYAQLDEFYARHFNRRRALRVRPWLDRKIKVELRWGDQDILGQMYDLSESGVGIVVTRDNAKRLEEISRVELTFRLPGAAAPCFGMAVIRHVSRVANSVLIGMDFDLEAIDGMCKHVAEVRCFVEKRATEMAKWEESWS